MRRSAIGVCLALLTGCGQAPATGPVETPQPPANPAPLLVPNPAPAPAPQAAAFWTLATLPLGDFPGKSAWVNEADDLAANHLTDTPWVIPGHWDVTTGEKLGLTDHIVEQTETRPDPVASFVRPSGMTGGKLPEHYKASVLALADTAPRGREAALLAWFQDVTHYVELVAKPDGLEVWQADGAAPDHEDGWTRLWRKDLPTAQGQARRLGLDVDTRSGVLQVYLDGKNVGEAQAPLISSSEPDHTLALRSIGGPVYYGDLEVDTLP